MNIIKIIFVTAVLLSFNPFLNKLDDGIGIDRCFDDGTSLTIFELKFPENVDFLYAHGGGLNKCGCHYNRQTNECHCHRNRGCGCECQPSSCN